MNTAMLFLDKNLELQYKMKVIPQGNTRWTKYITGSDTATFFEKSAKASKFLLGDLECHKMAAQLFNIVGMTEMPHSLVVTEHVTDPQTLDTVTLYNEFGKELGSFPQNSVARKITLMSKMPCVEDSQKIIQLDHHIINIYLKQEKKKHATLE
ncbi:hypothetical protein D3C78_20250 [compost metagenome]